MRLSVLFALLLLSSAQFASFNYAGFINGTKNSDNSDFYKFGQPTGLLYVDGTLYVAESGKNAVYIYDAESLARTKVLIGEGGVGPVQNPLRMAYEAGTLYIADGISASIRTYTGDGFNVQKWTEGSNLLKPTGIALDSEHMYIADTGKQQVFIYSRSTKAYEKVGIDKGPSDGQLDSPADIAIYGGNFYVSDSAKNVIFVYDQNFSLLSTIGRGRGGVSLLSPHGFQVDSDRIYVADSGNNRVVVFSLDGYPLEILDKLTPEGNFSSPQDVAVQGSTLYVADGDAKLVKIFSINYTVKNDSVLQAISAANVSVQHLLELQEVAFRLNLTFESTAAQQDMFMALSDYQNYLFSSSSALAEKALRESDAAQEVLQQDISIKVLQTVKEQGERVEPYRSQQVLGLKEKLAQFDNRVEDAKNKLAAKSYSPAVDAALSLSGLADSIGELVTGKKAEAETQQKNAAFSSFSADYAELLSELGAVRAKAEKYQQQVNLSSSESYLNQSLAQAADGDYIGANYSLALARLEITSTDSSLEALGTGIEAALANISSFDARLQQLSSKPSLVPADLAPELLLMSQSRQSAYTNPELAVESARQALSSAEVKVRDAQAVSMAAAAIIVIVFLIGVVAISFFLHLRRRRSRMQQEAVEEAEKELHHRKK